ncbi:hypothetical protein SDC9_183676 [bioreactor metagenome]|uniref:Uncharacterized protein n=1 Tax=bioreactor metagenome TaxID=1076179 RepID=A0A645HDG7_9ZZZZ
MTNRESAVCGNISRAETGTAEAGADGNTGRHQGGDVTLTGQLEHDRLAGGVAGEPEGIGSHRPGSDDFSSPLHILIGTA